MKKVQFPSQLPRRVTAPCDKLSKKFFNLTENQYLVVLAKGATYREDKKGEVKVEYRLELLEGYEDKLPPDARHREVLFACIELYEAGFKVVTPAQIVRHMTGSEQVNVWPELKPIIDKLMKTLVTINLEPLKKLNPRRKDSYSKRFKEPKYKKYLKITGTLLPAQYLESKVNGQETITIEMLTESPLMKVAEFKRQTVTYDKAPLKIPGKRDTLRQTVIKNCLLRRINLTAPSRQKPMNRSIRFETLLTECGLADATKRQKQEARNAVIALLEHFKAEGVMRDFEIVKSGQVYRSITIMF